MKDWLEKIQLMISHRSRFFIDSAKLLFIKSCKLPASVFVATGWSLLLLLPALPAQAETAQAVPAQVETSQLEAEPESNKSPEIKLNLPLSWYPRSYLNNDELEILPSYCAGKYRTVQTLATPDDNLSAEQQAERQALQQKIIAEADASDADSEGNVTLTGDVQLDYQGMRITSDQASWLQDGGGSFSGNVQMNTQGMVVQGQHAQINSQTDVDGTVQNHAEIEQAQYSIPTLHYRGSAKKIKMRGEDKILMQDATFTACEPGRNDWDIRASELSLNREEGRGEAWHTRFRIGTVPVLYFPYYSFPIDDRRQTGFLDPTFSFLGGGELRDAQVPFYINLHPQADATITPHFIRDRGMLWETQFRHLTKTFGSGELNYGLLAEDETSGKKRESINYTQSGRINADWRHSLEYNKLSDVDYINDLNTSLAINRSTHLPRRAQLLFDKSAWHFDVIGEEFQTIDETIALSSRPYRRLPQLNLSYSPSSFVGWSSQWKVQASQFSRDNEGLTGLSRSQADRLVMDGLVNYQWQWPFAYIKPQLEYKTRFYQLHDSDETNLGSDFNNQPSVTVPKYSLQAGMFFERELSLAGNSLLQTLEPKLMYLEVPYRDQQDIPLFDTSGLTFNYNQLFRDYRFNGGDRVGDSKQLTAGLTSRLLSDQGEEILRASIGQIFYLADQRVTLGADNQGSQQNKSSVVSELDWQIGRHLRSYGMVEYDPYQGEYLQEQLNLEFDDKQNHLFNLGLRTNEPQLIRQLKLGAFWAFNDSWSLIASQTRDIWNYKKTQVKPVNPVLDEVVGLEYQNCCWRVQFLYQEESKRVSLAQASTSKDYRFLLKFELKGLTSVGANSEKLLQQSIKGYSRRVYDNH